MRAQVLDTMELERERGITIKAQAVRVTWKGHELNLIDTPGHVDFTYEVSRALQACEGAVLVVDAAQGIEAQTVANAYLAIDNDLELLPVANKIDLPAADTLGAGEVGYIVTGLKDVAKLRVGDTLTTQAHPASDPLPGYKDVKPMVFAALFPTDSDEYPQLRDALERLRLNDASLSYEPETSQALGFGFRCGFLGLLHMEIVRERLEREFDLDLLVTAPTVAYNVTTPAGDVVEVHNPAEMPPERERADEPSVRASIVVPQEGVGQVVELRTDRRGRFDPLEYQSPGRVTLVYALPLAEIVFDFY